MQWEREFFNAIGIYRTGTCRVVFTVEFLCEGPSQYERGGPPAFHRVATVWNNHSQEFYRDWEWPPQMKTANFQYSIFVEATDMPALVGLVALYTYEGIVSPVRDRNHPLAI